MIATEVESQPKPSWLRRVALSALRITLAVVGIVALAIGVLFASNWNRNRHSDGRNPKVEATVLGSFASSLDTKGFVGCPTAQQVFELSDAKEREELRKVTNGIDPWGTPYQIRCDLDRLHVYSMGPDRKPGTEDDVHGLR